MTMTMSNRMLNSVASSESPRPESPFTIGWMCFVLLLMFLLLISDKVGADLVMMLALTLCMLANIVTVAQGTFGFSNEGLLTVMVLFVVAGGISRTGGLDWYMSKALGRPRTMVGAQLKLMVPIAVISAFLNNTPVVMVMIPIVQRWGKAIKVSVSQLLIPLSFASILGGTCTLIGTSTNLVVEGLLREVDFCLPKYQNAVNQKYCDSPPTIGLFDLGKYGVPIVFVGMAYIICFSTLLLPNNPPDACAPGAAQDDDIMVRAKVLKWSPVAGKTVRDSGMRGLPGMFLVSVQDFDSGITTRAVGPEMVLSVGDLLSFSGKFDDFGRVCSEYGLEAVTNENDDGAEGRNGTVEASEPLERVVEEEDQQGQNLQEFDQGEGAKAAEPPPSHPNISLATYGSTKEEFMTSSRDVRYAAILALREMMDTHAAAGPGNASTPPSGKRSRSTSLGSRPQGGGGEERAPQGGRTPNRQNSGDRSSALTFLNSLAPATVVVSPDPLTSKKNVILLGVNAPDRPGLLHDISKGLARLSLQALRTEAHVVGLRSASIWRCEVGGSLRRERRLRYGVDEGDVEEIWSVLNALLETEGGGEAAKQRGLRVVRTRVTGESTLLGKTAKEAKFRVCFRAAIVAVKRGGGVLGGTLRDVRFEKNDVLLLQVGDDSPLGPGFFIGGDEVSQEMVDLDVSTLSSPRPLDALNKSMADLEANRAIVSDLVRDLLVETPISFHDGEEGGDILGTFVGQEFLSAMVVAKGSKLAGRTMEQSGISKLPGVHLFSIERPVARGVPGGPGEGAAGPGGPIP
ncbi:hypothetical protein TrRE_jg10071, partial [Triparma retinervis]